MVEPMTELPTPQHSIPALIDEYFAGLSDQPRPHLGASIMGHHCERWLWLSFRWAVTERFPGRIRRVFRRGHHEENWVVADLLAIGIDVRSTGDNQQFVQLGGHLGGSLDGIIERGVPEAPGKRHVLEIKTHSAKSFADLKKGVQESKPMHYVQMQAYMHATGIDRALYVAVCKDDDQIYVERVRYDREAAEKAIARAHRVSTDDRIPSPISTDPAWYQCKMCAGHDFCFGSRLTKNINCRTCALSTATADGQWTCERWGKSVIPTEHQYAGCDCHVLHPDLVPWKLIPGEADFEAVYEIDGRPVRNGEPDAYVYGSSEILANPGACSDPDPVAETVRTKMGGRIQG